MTNTLQARSTLIRRHQCGAASLVVIVLLLAALAITAGFTNRNLVFEQKTSSNQFRSTLAMEAAEAGLEWATAMLNKRGRITSSCENSAVTTDTSYRERYLSYDPDTVLWEPIAASGTIISACVASQDATGWSCSCPAPGTVPAPAIPAVGGYKPGFAIALVSSGSPKTVDLVSYGCTSPITTATCTGDGAATVRVTLGNIPAMPTAPGAPLTARGSVDIGNAALGVHNGDPNTAGVTINAGMGIDASKVRITTTPGTPPLTTLVGNDDSLRSSTEDQMFQTYFNVPKATWKESVADLVLNCPCTEVDVQRALDDGHRLLWLQGDLDMNATLTLGSIEEPLILVVDGAIHLNGNLTIYGVVYSTAMQWDQTGGGSALLVGAAISEGSYTGTGSPDFYYDPRVIEDFDDEGKFARVPGSWRDH